MQRIPLHRIREWIRRSDGFHRAALSPQPRLDYTVI
jgi:hypothetical protein